VDEGRVNANPSAVLRTGIEYRILNGEVEIAVPAFAGTSSAALLAMTAGVVC